ncbi:hypothetical protein DPMN_021902 [Dreissena polymorpha]|uniref:Uncharacterized protein n=1 Tax=Dreissena polymorpha TaxID=45954 RepID=A0A9D4NJC9_DREPO|nr:hypothetical protein DPMN_021902 [Dreissena polymorpha]
MKVGEETQHSHEAYTSVLIQLLTKFGEDRMKFQDRPTDGRTDRQSDSYIAPITNDRSSIFFLKVKGLSFSITKEERCGGVGGGGVGTGDGLVVSSNKHKRLGSKTHWKTMRILGIKQRIIVNMNEPHWKTMRILGIKPLWKTMRISGISTDRESVLSRKSPESVLSIVSRESVLSKPGISTDTVQPTRNKRISRSAVARRNEAMPLCGGKSHFAVKLRICPRRHAAICDMMPSRCAS